MFRERVEEEGKEREKKCVDNGGDGKAVKGCVYGNASRSRRSEGVNGVEME